MELTILMPCLNEAQTLEACITKAQRFLQRAGIDGEVLIADNGSDDGSQQIAQAHGARVVDIASRGYGAALIGGIAAARGRFVIMGDADDSYDFSHLDAFVEQLRGGAQLVMGNRFRGGIAAGAMPPLHRYLGNPVLTGIGRLFFPSAIGDFHCGLRGFERDVAEMLGITNSESDPAYDDAVELWECWRPNAPDGARYCVILNRKTIINKDPTQLPYWHGQIPFIPIRNVSVPGHLLGISEIQEPEKLYYEMNALRNLRLDAVTLAVLPMFLKMREVGIADFQRHMKPGGIIEAGRADALQQLTKFGSDIGNAFRELDTIKADIDETNATPSHLRGSPSTVGRVSATEAERRFSQSLTRQKQRVLRIEDELQPMVRQMLFLWYQFGDPVVRVAAGDGQDSIAEVERDRFFEALELDFRFRGASKALNKDLLSQQLMTFLRDNRGDLTPR